jgi:hypothetical protein
MDLASLRRESPATLPVQTGEKTVVLDRADDLVAVHGGAGPPQPLLSLEDGRVTVHRTTDVAASDLPAEAVGPVYRTGPRAGPAVPTGRVLVRYGAGDRIDRHRAELAAAGYELEEVLGYAPQAGWVRGPRISDALRGLERLAALDGVKHVEPQLLREASRKR